MAAVLSSGDFFRTSSSSTIGICAYQRSVISNTMPFLCNVSLYAFIGRPLPYE